MAAKEWSSDHDCVLSNFLARRQEARGSADEKLPNQGLM
ncbi:hypothetical protein THIX_90647 [Thiomonas sp. X19]|nr:hypothetical protein THIX_90647 [Thiomonas sp. X19]